MQLPKRKVLGLRFSLPFVEADVSSLAEAMVAFFAADWLSCFFGVINIWSASSSSFKKPRKGFFDFSESLHSNVTTFSSTRIASYCNEFLQYSVFAIGFPVSVTSVWLSVVVLTRYKKGFVLILLLLDQFGDQDQSSGISTLEPECSCYQDSLRCWTFPHFLVGNYHH